MDSGVIRNCECHTKIVGEDVDVNVDMLMQRDSCVLDNEIDQVVQNWSERMQVEYLPHHESEMDSA